MAGVKTSYFNGIRLWEVLKHWKPGSVRTGQARKQGTGKKRGKLMPHSPNHFYEILVHTAVNPVTALSGIGRQETFNLQMLQVQASLLNASGELGYLSWCQDNSEVLDVTGVTPPMAYPGSGTVTYSGSGFVAAAGQDVLFRNPTTGAGFCARLTSGGGGTLQAVLQEAITSDWEVIRVIFYFPGVNYLTMGGWETATQAEDRHTFDAMYSFEADEDVSFATAFSMNLS